MPPWRNDVNVSRGTIQDEKWKVTDVCEQYLKLLGAIVAQFLAENG